MEDLPGQKQGNTIPRQRDITTRCAEVRGWRVASSFYDDGMSAWTGSNIIKGNLAKFIEALGPDGGHGKVLVVEQLDRLTRRPPLDVLNWMQRATATGLSIYTANDGMMISNQRLRVGAVENHIGSSARPGPALRPFQPLLEASPNAGEVSKNRAMRQEVIDLLQGFEHRTGSTSVQSIRSADRRRSRLEATVH